MKRVLITGAAGFLGSHLCDRFIKEGYYVIAMDNLITGDMKNIEHLIEIFNINGEIIDEIKITDKHASFDTSHYKKGLYFFRIFDKDKKNVSHKKMIKL